MTEPAIPHGLQILLLEDSAFDAELLQAALASACPDVQLTWVSNETGFSGALAQQRFDLIMSDYQLPDYSGDEALTLAREAAAQTPFIFVSGVIGEENTVELLKRGATDYVMKGRLSRLPVVIERALREVEQREAQQLAQQQLRQAKEDAERSNELKDQFLAVLSHELRSPLSAIAGWADILEQRAAGDSLQAKAATVIRRNARLQTRMINDLLDMSAVVAGKLTLQTAPLDLAALAAECVLPQLQAAQEQQVALQCSSTQPLWVNGDEQRLAQVLASLLGNALKFTDAGGHIAVETTAEGDQAVLRVRDTGRGISPAFLPHVFDRLRQEDGSITRKAGGLGLGLAIARAIVELHGGSICAQSEGPDCGALFEVRLPLIEAPRQRAAMTAAEVAQQAQPGQQQDLQGLQVLLVDDEADARELGQAMLGSMGADVQVAAGAREALALLQRQRFDLMVSDIGMPEMDGLSLMQAVRKLPDPATASMPAVALTAFTMLRDRQAGLHAGFHAYVTKPMDRQTLGSAIRSALGAAGSAQHQEPPR